MWSVKRTVDTHSGLDRCSMSPPLSQSGVSPDFLAARRNGFEGGFNSGMDVGPIETVGNLGAERWSQENDGYDGCSFRHGFWPGQIRLDNCNLGGVGRA